MKDPNFVNGYFSAMNDTLMQEMGASAESATTAKPLPGKNGEDAGKAQDTEESNAAAAAGDEQKVTATEGSAQLREPQMSYNEDLFDRRRRWARGISIYRLVNGKFQPKEVDEEIKKSQQMEDERKRKIEEEDRNNQNADAFKSSIKSRKALQVAINDKSTPPAIRNLRMTMNVVVVALLALAITEFTIISSQFKDINENFNLIQQSYGRVSEIQRIAYDVRTLIMINERKQTVYQNYTTTGDFIGYMQGDIEAALNNLYDLQNSISLTSLAMNPNQLNLTETKSVTLYFKEYDQSLKTLQFSLAEAVLQISSAVFTVRHLNLTDYVET